MSINYVNFNDFKTAKQLVEDNQNDIMTVADAMRVIINNSDKFDYLEYIKAANIICEAYGYGDEITIKEGRVSDFIKMTIGNSNNKSIICKAITNEICNMFVDDKNTLLSNSNQEVASFINSVLSSNQSNTQNQQQDQQQTGTLVQSYDIESKNVLSERNC